MARRDPVAQALDRVRELREKPDPNGVRELLAVKHGWVVAAAADIAKEQGWHALSGDIAAAYDRLFDDANKRDPGCKGKVAAAGALDALDWMRVETFERGFAWQQHEPVWGGTEDTAVPLRATCLSALVRLRPVDVGVRLADGLCDPAPKVRSAAAHAAGSVGVLLGVPLLRLFVGRMGPEEDEVLTDAMASLLELDAGQLPWVVRQLASGSSRHRQAAAFAIGEARRPEGFAPLRDALDTADREDTRAILVAMATLRHPPATAFLLERAREGDRAEALPAVAALAVLAHDPAVREALEEIGRTRRGLGDAVDRALGLTRGGGDDDEDDDR